MTFSDGLILIQYVGIVALFLMMYLVYRKEVGK